MKVIFYYCIQARSYGDSYGQCLVELENDDTIDDVRKKYVNVPRDWWEQKYANAIQLSSYVETKYDGEQITHTGRLVLMNTHREYLD